MIYKILNITSLHSKTMSPLSEFRESNEEQFKKCSEGINSYAAMEQLLKELRGVAEWNIENADGNKKDYWWRMKRLADVFLVKVKDKSDDGEVGEKTLKSFHQIFTELYDLIESS